MASDRETFDFIIVGGGTAGLVLAARLSDDPKLGKVLVIEAGVDQTQDPRVNAPLMGSALLSTPSNWAFEFVPQPGLKGRKGVVPLGRVLGGSSAINMLSFAPPSKSIIDIWEKLGNPGWDWNSFYESLTKSYSLTDCDNRPLKLSFPDDDEDWRWPAIWRDTLERMGHPVDVNLYSAQGEHYGTAFTADSIDMVKKQRSYAAHYLEQVSHRENLTVWTGVMAEKILFDEHRDKNGDLRAIGVMYTDAHGRTKTVTASKEVIITAGTLNSPKLLELSGIGDRGRLEPLGISQVLLDNPAVGQNLQNHIMCSLCFEVRPTQERGLGTMDSISRQDPAALGAAMETYTQKQAGPFSRSGTNATALLPLPTAALLKDNAIEFDQYLGKDSAAFVRQRENFARSLLSSPTGPSAHYLTFAGFAAVADDGSMASPPADDKTYFTIAVSLAHPLSRGSSHITSSSASSRPNIDPAYLSHPLDLEVLSRHLQFVASTLSKSEPLASRITRNLGNAAMSADELEDLQNAKDFVASKATGAAHYVGTCSMLPRELGGVVDSRLRVYGCSNLRVSDASIVPVIPSSNLQATVYGVAEHGAGIIIADYS